MLELPQPSCTILEQSACAQEQDAIARPGWKALLQTSHHLIFFLEC